MVNLFSFIFCAFCLSFCVPLQADVVKKLSCDFGSEFGRGHLSLCGGLRDDGTLKLNENLDHLIFYQANGLADIYFPKEGCYWISRARVLRKTICQGKSPEPMQDGLARYVDSRGQFGFVNEKLKIVIPPAYDFASPFLRENSLVCKKCLVRPIKFDLSGDLIKPVGGQWYIIDKTGKVLKECARHETFQTCKVNQSNPEALKTKE